MRLMGILLALRCAVFKFLRVAFLCFSTKSWIWWWILLTLILFMDSSMSAWSSWCHTASVHACMQLFSHFYPLAVGNKDELRGGWKRDFWLFHWPEGPSRKLLFIWEEAAMPWRLQTALQLRPHLLPAQGPWALLGPLGKNGFRDTTGVTQKGTWDHHRLLSSELNKLYFKNKKKRGSSSLVGVGGAASVVAPSASLQTVATGSFQLDQSDL